MYLGTYSLCSRLKYMYTWPTIIHAVDKIQKSSLMTSLNLPTAFIQTSYYFTHSPTVCCSTTKSRRPGTTSQYPFVPSQLPTPNIANPPSAPSQPTNSNQTMLDSLCIYPKVPPADREPRQSTALPRRKVVRYRLQYRAGGRGSLP